MYSCVCVLAEHASTSVLSPCYHCLSLPCSKTDQTVTPMQALTIGAAARTIAASSVLPITVVKTRYEVSKPLGKLFLY